MMSCSQTVYHVSLKRQVGVNMNSKHSAAARSGTESSELAQLLHRIHNLEARIAELDTEDSMIIRTRMPAATTGASP